MNSLTRRVVLNWGTRFVVLSALLFVPANSLNFPRGWSFLAVYFLPQAVMVGYFLRTDPTFLERRLKIGPGAETRTRQKLVMVVVILSSFVSIIIAGYDHRFSWSHVSIIVSMAAWVVMLIGIWIQFRVFVENRFASATIEIAADQRVITTGPYAFVRHPMYCGALLTDCCIPLVLGSWWALLPVVVKVPVLAVRLLDEEEFLRAKLSGYADYCQKVPHRLIPVLWCFLCFLLFAAMSVNHAQAAGKTSQSIYSVLRAPLPPEDLALSQNRTEFVIQGPTFTYRVAKRTGVIASIRVVHDKQELISSRGPADIVLDQYQLDSSLNSCSVTILSRSKEKIELQAKGILRDAGKRGPEVDFSILHTFFNDGVVVLAVKLTPRADLLVKQALLCRLPAQGQFTGYLHKRRDEHGEAAVRGKLPGAGGAVRVSTLTSCLSVYSPESALAIFTDCGATHLSRPNVDTAVVEVNRREGSDDGVNLSQYLIHIAPGDEPYVLKAGEEFAFRTGISLAPNRFEHPRAHDLRMFIWIGDAKYPYPTDEEITNVARWGYNLFQLHRAGTAGEPRPPAGEFERVLRKVHELGMLYIFEENADLLYASAPGVLEMQAKGRWPLWQGFNYDGRYVAKMDPYCDLIATCLASPNGMAEYRLGNINRMLDRFPVDGIYLDDNLAYPNCTLWKEHGHPRPTYDCLIELHDINWRRRQLLRRRVPHAVLISHNTKAFVLPIIADFDIQYFAEGYCFNSTQDYWDNYRAWSLSLNAQAMICPGDDEGVRCGAALACNYDLLSGGGQYSQMDWRLFPTKFHYAGGVTGAELEYSRTYNLIQAYFGLYESKPFYFATSTNLFTTSARQTFATVYQNRVWNDWLIPIANMDSTAQMTSLVFRSPETLGILPRENYLLLDIHHRVASSFRGEALNQAFNAISIPAQNMQIYNIRKHTAEKPCHLWGGKRLSETWDNNKRKLTFEIEGPPTLEDTVFIWAKNGIEKVSVAGQAAPFSFDRARNLVHGPVTYTRGPLKIEVFCSPDNANHLPDGGVNADPIAK